MAQLLLHRSAFWAARPDKATCTARQSIWQGPKQLLCGFTGCRRSVGTCCAGAMCHSPVVLWYQRLHKLCVPTAGGMQVHTNEKCEQHLHQPVNRDAVQQESCQTCAPAAPARSGSLEHRSGRRSGILERLSGVNPTSRRQEGCLNSFWEGAQAACLPSPLPCPPAALH